MKIETLEVSGFKPALHAMRNPMDSWKKSDTVWHTTKELYPDEPFTTVIDFMTGENDKDLSIRLQKAGPEHCKHLRMIMAYADITADLAFYKQLDTYRAGVEKVSCSTMHKLTSRFLTINDFEQVHAEKPYWPAELTAIIGWLNTKMLIYRNEEDPVKKAEMWKEIINLLPESYLQKRTYMFSYAALRMIYRQREGHKMTEWMEFRKWVEGLPESWMITE